MPVNTPDAAYNSHTVRQFRQILLFPLHVTPLGRLKEVRDSSKISPAKGLKEYADWCHDFTLWRRIDDYLLDPGDRTIHPSRMQAQYESDQAIFDHDPRGNRPLNLTERIERQRRQRAEEFIYFHPFIQQFLFSNKPAEERPIQVLQRHDVHSARITVSSGTQTLHTVDRLLLFLFPSDVAILAVELAATQPLPLSDVMDLLNESRRAYTPYWKAKFDPQNTLTINAECVPLSFEWFDHQGAALATSDFSDSASAVNTILNHRRPPLAAHWDFLLLPLRPLGAHEPGLLFEQIEDERLPVFAYLRVDNAAHITNGDFSRLLFCDGPGNSTVYPMPYSTNFMQPVVPEHAYDRYWNPAVGQATRYLFSSVSFIAIGDSRDNFFKNEIQHHFRFHYFHLGLIAHLHKASLLVYWKRLATLLHTYSAQPASPKSREQFHRGSKSLMEDLADFVSRFWFTEVSNQLQPTEMFAKWSEQLGTEKLYQQVMEQAKLIREVRFAEWQESTTNFANLLAPFLTATAILGLSVGIGDLWEHFLPKSSPAPLLFSWTILILAALTAVCYFFIRWLKRRNWHE